MKHLRPVETRLCQLCRIQQLAHCRTSSPCGTLVRVLLTTARTCCRIVKHHLIVFPRNLSRSRSNLFHATTTDGGRKVVYPPFRCSVIACHDMSCILCLYRLVQATTKMVGSTSGIRMGAVAPNKISKFRQRVPDTLDRRA